jgi:hypothetical protein
MPLPPDIDPLGLSYDYPFDYGMPTRMEAQNALGRAVRKQPALTMPSQGPGLSRSEQLMQQLSERMAQRPDETTLIEQAGRREASADQQFKLGMLMSTLGGQAFQPAGEHILRRALESQKPMDIPGGWGTVEGGKVVWNPAKQREEDLRHLETQLKIADTAEQRAAQAEQLNAYRQAVLGQGQQRIEQGQQRLDRPDEAVVPVFDPDSGTTRYMSRAQAAGQQVPPRAGAAPGGARLSPAAIDKVTEDQGKVQQFSNLLGSWKPEYGGMGTSIGNVWGDISPMASEGSRAQAMWWRQYQAFVNEMRHGQFGASLTPTEKAEFEKAIITSNTDPRQMDAFLQENLRLAQLAAAKRLQNYKAGGYNIQQFEQGGGETVIDFNALPPRK